MTNTINETTDKEEIETLDIHIKGNVMKGGNV